MTDQPHDLPTLFAQIMEAKPEQRAELIDQLAAHDPALQRELLRLVSTASDPSSADDPLSDRAIASRREQLESVGTTSEPYHAATP